MGNQVSTMRSSRVTKKAKKRIKLRGMFNYPNGRNIPEEFNSTKPNHWVTVFFNWADHKYNDEELMDLVVARINARDGIISSEPVHHDVKWCLSLRVPGYWNPTDTSVAGAAKVVAQWHQSEMRHAGMKINRRYLFRSNNRKRPKKRQCPNTHTPIPHDTKVDTRKLVTSKLVAPDAFP